MNQLSLNIRPKIAYSADNFLMHSGVKNSFEQLMAGLQTDAFSLSFFVAPERGGKSHFSVKLCEELLKKRFYPQLVDGAEFSDWMTDHLCFSAAGSDYVVIVDDAHYYFNELKAGRSGEFVSFIEALRLARAKIIFLSLRAIDDFVLDDHVVSRLIPGAGFVIDSPAEDEMPYIIESMAKQRGIRLSPKKVLFLCKRLGRDLPSVERYFERVSYLSSVIGRGINFKVVADAV